MQTRAAIYVRISEDREGAGLGVERQRSDCAAAAAQLKATVVRTYVDNDISASSGKVRPEYRRLLADIRAGHIDTVIVWHTDRLHRRPIELEEWLDACETRGVTVTTVKAGPLDLATPSGRMVARLLGATARYEVEHRGERIARKHQEHALAGKWRGGTRPFGWSVDEAGRWVLDPVEAPMVRDAAHLVLAGSSLYSIVRAWNAKGVTTTTGRPWVHVTLRQMLRRPRNAGWSEYRGELVARMEWPPILDEDTWRAVCSLLDDQRRRTLASNRVRWLLSGIALCGACGAAVKVNMAHPPGGRPAYRTYRCPTRGPGHVARRVEFVDATVEDTLLHGLARPGFLDLLDPPAASPDVAALRVEVVTLQRRMDEVADQYVDGGITARQLASINEQLTKRIRDAEGRLAARHRTHVVTDLAGPDPGPRWASLGIDRRRAIVDALMEVTILPIPAGARLNVFDPELIRTRWRWGAV